MRFFFFFLQSTIKLKAMNRKMMNWHIMTFLLVIIGRLLLNVMKFFDFFFLFVRLKGKDYVKKRKESSKIFKTTTCSSKCLRFTFSLLTKQYLFFPAYLKPNLPRIIVCENRWAAKTSTTPRINITRMWNLQQSRNSLKKI